ncbi:MAG: MHYT domain-containing protein [Gammaproteobacteria bacterium]
MNGSYNITLLILSYLISVGGSLAALLLARKAIASQVASQKMMRMLSAAVALGGVGIWAMHFIGMLAFSMEGLPIHYDMLMTLGSLFIAIAIVYVGFLGIRHGKPGILKLISMGAIVGFGVAGMHYAGMMAIEVAADIIWNQQIVILSIVIAIVAATVALSLAAYLTKFWHMVISAIVMGIAVCGMHYTGMYAASFIPNGQHPGSAPVLENIVFGGIIGFVAIGILGVLFIFNMGMEIEPETVT